uniref:Neuronal pentraxin 1 n=1 Tax=Taeniopygia guttata TaxID=59729 RepID=A0A674HGP5_TAEGU
MNSSSQTNSLKDILQNKIDDLEKQVLSRVNSLEEGKLSPRNESEERGKIESTLTSLHQRISDLEKGQKDNRPPDRFQLTFPLRTNYMYAKVKKSLPEMYAFSICMWIKSSASPGMGTPFSYAVPGQANELVLIEWGNNPMEILINDKVQPRGVGRVLGWGGSVGDPRVHHPDPLPAGGQAALCHQRRQVAPHLCHLDHAGRRVGSLPGRHPDGQRREPGPLPPHQAAGRPGAGPGAGHAGRRFRCHAGLRGGAGPLQRVGPQAEPGGGVRPGHLQLQGTRGQRHRLGRGQHRHLRRGHQVDFRGLSPAQLGPRTSERNLLSGFFYLFFFPPFFAQKQPRTKPPDSSREQGCPGSGAPAPGAPRPSGFCLANVLQRLRALAWRGCASPPPPGPAPASPPLSSGTGA